MNDQIIPPTRERRLHDEIEVREAEIIAGRKEMVFAVKDPTRVDKYWRRGVLGDRDEAGVLQQIGNELGRLFHVAGLGERYATLNLLRVDNQPFDIESSKLRALEKLRKTLAQIGPTHASCLHSICGLEHSAESWAAGRRLPPRSGMAFLVDALRLVRRAWGR